MNEVAPTIRGWVPLTTWRSQGSYCKHCGCGEWWAAPGYEIHKKAGIWVATHKGRQVAQDEHLSNVMLALEIGASHE